MKLNILFGSFLREAFISPPALRVACASLLRLMVVLQFASSWLGHVAIKLWNAFTFDL